MPKMLEEQQEEQVFEAKSGMIRHAFQKHNPYFFYCKQIVWMQMRKQKINQEAIARIHRIDNGYSNQSNIIGHSETNEVLGML